jgi:ribonucleotide reductase beta subunit family protein with ferritin-like domain
MLDNLVKKKAEREHCFNAIQTVDSVKMISDWAFKWIDSDLSFAHRVIAFCIIEGVFFSGAFASIFWLKRYKSNGRLFLQGLVKSNEFIARDECLHLQFGCEIYKMIVNKLSTKDAYQIFDEGVTIAKLFMTDALPVKLIGMNNESMGEYIEYVSDRLLVDLGYPKKYMTNNPFSFMETIGMTGKTNFFESRPTEYQSAHSFSDEIDKNKDEILDDF